MIEIIKKGKLPKYKFKCFDCSTEFIAEETDICEEKLYSIAWVNVLQLFVNCPVCGKKWTFDNYSHLKEFRVKESGDSNA
jgi:uncharacterized protein with PIN domain